MRQLWCFLRNSRRALWPAEKKFANSTPTRGLGAVSTRDTTPHKETSRDSPFKSKVTSMGVFSDRPSPSVSRYIPPQLTFSAVAGINFPLWRMVTGRSTDTRRCLLFSITPPFYTPESADARAFNYAIGTPLKMLLTFLSLRVLPHGRAWQSPCNHGDCFACARNDKGLLQFILPWM